MDEESCYCFPAKNDSSGCQSGWSCTLKEKEEIPRNQHGFLPCFCFLFVIDLLDWGYNVSAVHGDCKNFL